MAACDKLGASIKGKVGRAAQKFQCGNGLEHHDAGMVDPEPFSVSKYLYNVFVDTIVEWIIADDQVCEYSCVFLNIIDNITVHLCS